MGGGIALLYKEYIKVTSHKTYRNLSMECTDFMINNIKHIEKLHLILIYKPLDRSVLQFCNDLTDYLEENILESGEVMLSVDFNTKVNDEEDSYIITFQDFWTVSI